MLPLVGREASCLVHYVARTGFRPYELAWQRSKGIETAAARKFVRLEKGTTVAFAKAE